MNISTNPWIPIAWLDGQTDMVSLTEAFARGNEIRDLTVQPHERIALMRLFICVTQAALDGPADYDEWKTCQPRIISSVHNYLKRWQHTFELFGNDQRFLQLGNLKKPDIGDAGDNLVSKLDLTLATGNAPTLFDGGAGTERSFTPAQLVLMLLTSQCFSPGGRIGVAKWSGVETTGNGSSTHAPCIAGNMLHTLLRGNNLLDTLRLNLLTKQRIKLFFGDDGWGRPVWEFMPKAPTDEPAVRNATETYLGRLVALSRAVHLTENETSLIYANGLLYPSYPEKREPSATIVSRKDNKGQPIRKVLSASVEKAVWRELHALTVKAVSQGRDSVGGSEVLQNVSDKEAVDLWVGGLVANKAKLMDSVEAVFHVPAAMLTEQRRVLYEQGVLSAEKTGFRLMQAVAMFHNKLGDNLNRSELRERRRQIQTKATVQFWTDVEQSVPLLLELVDAPESLGLKAEWHKTVWGQSVWRAARTAYERACPHETPRQMQAYVLGLKALFAVPAEQTENEPAEEVLL